MLEIVKNKVMMTVAVVLLGVVFINAGISNKLEEDSNEASEKMIAMNIS